jgi:DNA-binding response OmpR family regulator
VPRLLLVEVDPFLRRTLQKLFAGEGYYCAVAANPEAAQRTLRGSSFDLLVLDVGRTGPAGLQLVREIRTSHHVPVLLLAEDGGVDAMVAGLDVGADDYLREPFDPRELLARVRAQLRRGAEYVEQAISEPLQLGRITLDVARRDAFHEGQALNLTPREFSVLHLLARYRDQTLAAAWLFESVWGTAAERGFKRLTVCIGRLRRKIEADPQHPQLLVSVRGHGYRLVTGTH